MKNSLSKLVRSPELETLALMLLRPNIFEILRVSHFEIRHSNFLAWLLDPKQGHNLGDTFLKWFLKEIFQDNKITWIDEFQVDSVRISDVKIHREYRHIDLLLEFPDWVLIIENKFGSKEHNDQLARYRTNLEKEFPNKQKAYVYLTPYRDEPEQESDCEVYVTFDYASIVALLERALEIYSQTLSSSVINYLRDYVEILKRDVMGTSESIELAKKIYENHREALDFIFEHKPDRLAEIDKIVAERILSRGYVLGASNKGRTRFLTKELVPFVTSKKAEDRSVRESFLFELNYRRKSVLLRTTVVTENDALKEQLFAALHRVDGARQKQRKHLKTVHSKSYRYDLASENYADDDSLMQVIDKILDEAEGFIKETSTCLIEALSEAN